MAYDIAGAFEDIEIALIKSMRNNMQRHINEEYDEGINWTQWQAEMLSGLSQYRAENADVLKGYMGRINAELDAAIREAYATGESEQEIELLKAIKRGYTPPKDASKTNLQGRFFRINQRKLNALVDATTKDMKKAETALLRMTDDVYRKTLFKAQMFYNTGAGSMWQCVDMATKDFLKSGINCVQYANGARVNIASYAEMALRTANKRANLMGQANKREQWGIHTVKVNARGIACPMCLQWPDKVYIDDVYGGGTAKESAQTGYPLLSTAVAGGLYHPNCKDSCSTYYEGISREPQPITKEQEEETLRRYNLEQKQRYYERNYKRNMRMGNGFLDQDNAQKYFDRALQFKNKLIDLCDNNADVLRYDKARLSLRGVLSVDNVGRLTITHKANKNANMGKITKEKDPLRPYKLAGVKVGKPMTHEDADTGKPNPNYFAGEGYKINCQSCVVSYEARRRGYNVQAKANMNNPVAKKLSYNTNLAWLDADGNHPKIVRSGAKNSKQLLKYMQDNMKEGERYTLQMYWRDYNSGHIIHAYKENGEIVLYDPQVPEAFAHTKGEDNILNYFKRLKYTRNGQDVSPNLLRVDNLRIDADIADGIMEEFKK